VEITAPTNGVPEPPRLDAYLTANVPDISRARIVGSIKDGLVNVNGKLIKKPSYKVCAGDAIVCRIPPTPPMEAAPENIPLDVAYEDDHLMVVNKPAGMVVHPSAGHETGTPPRALNPKPQTLNPKPYTP
jgi:23S rRNA pseudouridine1911/1915/1917 synthase